MKYNEFINILKNLDNEVPIYICGHITPDYDSASSSLALCYLLKMFGKIAIPLIEEDDKSKLRLIDNIDEFKNNVEHDNYNFIIVDANKLTRIPEKFQKHYNEAITRLNIDHHEGLIDVADYVLSFSELSSTTEIIYELFEHSGISIPKEIADLLLSGIVTDTKCFSNRTTYRTFEITSRLIKFGADNNKIINNLHIQRTNKEIEIIKEMLNALKYDDIYYFSLNLKNKKVDYNVITKKCIPFILSNEKVGFLLAYIVMDDLIRCEIRSKNGFDVSQIADSFGGGGHKNASGFSTDKSLEEVIMIIKKYIKDK